MICTKCKKDKPPELFKKTKQRKSGYSSWCKKCHSEDTCKSQKENRDRCNKNNSAYKKRHPKKTIERRKHDKALRRARLRQAIPSWANLDHIKDFYAKCPDGYEVDHIAPLVSDKVCGLHVVENMQYLTRSDNAKKGNHFEII